MKMYKMELLPGCGTHFIGVDSNGKSVKAVAAKDKGCVFVSSEDLSAKFVNKFRNLGMIDVKEDDPLILENRATPPKGFTETELETTSVPEEEANEEEETSEETEIEEKKELKINRATKQGYRVFLLQGKYIVTQEDGETEVATYDNKKQMLKDLLPKK